MINGTYSISMQMPDGVETGKVTFTETEGRLNGTLKAGNASSSFSDGMVNGNHFEFSGIMKKLFLKIPYTAKGEVQGNILSATADTKYGIFNIKGSRI